MPDSRKGSMVEDNDSPNNAGEKRASVSVKAKAIDLDYVLVNELGQFGRFQLISLAVISVSLILSGNMSEYIFSASAIPHRCMIPECGETADSAVYDTESLLSAYPRGASCERFVPIGINGTLDNCPAAMFHPTETIPCEAFVYQRKNSIVYDFDLGCESWLRVLPGTMVSVGSLLVLPFISYISDRWGRRIALIISVFSIGFFGLMRAFSVNYAMYTTLQLLQSTFGAGGFSAGYILATELVGPKYRVLTSATCSSMFALGRVVMGSYAWLIPPWRYFIMAINIPCFFVAIWYKWLLIESVRWLLSKEKFKEAKTVLDQVSKINKKQISEKSLQALMTPRPAPVTSAKGPGPGLIKTVVTSPVLLRRVCTTPIWWISSTLVYYGLSINSTTLPATNMYINYILTCAIEIPGFYTAVVVLDRFGRKTTLSIAYFLSAICNIAFVFIPDDLSALGLIVYLLGKFAISVVFTSLYLYTAELYPTEYRHMLLAFSSMIGRIGSITAPLTPALADYWFGIPSLMFAVMGALSGVLVLTQPETLGTKMPNTLAESEALGSPESKVNQT